MDMPENNIKEIRLPVMETFYSLQGEGIHQGRAAFFIRLAGCNVNCAWCDVKESWQTEGYPLKSPEELVQQVCLSPTEMVIITGGEPLIHHLGALTQKLREAGVRVHLETSGSSQLSGEWDWICLSPKKFREPLPAILPLANELKIVVSNKDDFRWAEKWEKQVTSSCNLILQAEWGRKEKIYPLIADYVKHHPKWRSGLQTHKYMNLR